MTTGARVKLEREARFDTKFFFLFFASFESSARAAVNKFKKMKSTRPVNNRFQND